MSSVVTTVLPTAEPISLVEAAAHIVYTDSADNQLITDMIVGAREFVESYTWRRMLLQTVLVQQDNWDGYVIELPVAPVIAVTQVQYINTAGVLTTLDPATWQFDNSSHIPRVMPVYGSIWPPVQLLTPNAVQITAIVGYATPYTTAHGTSNANLLAPGHQYANGQRVQLYNSGGALQAGLNISTNYFVVNANIAAGTLQLSLTSGGSAVTFTDDGTGLNFLGIVPRRLRQAMLLHIGLAYNNREAAVIDNRAAEVEIPFGLQAILDAYALRA